MDSQKVLSYGDFGRLYRISTFYLFDMKWLPCTVIIAKQNRNHSSEHPNKTGNE